MAFNNGGGGQTKKALGGALRVVVIYAVFSGLWILFSDAAVGFVFEDREIITLVSTLKGGLFVAVTSLLLYVLLVGLVNEATERSEREHEARRESERTAQLLRAIADSSGDAIFAKDERGRYLLFNREAARVTGKSSEEVIGQDDSFFFPPAEAFAISGNDRQVMVEGRVVTYEEALTTVAGERVFLATKGPLRDEAGKVIGVFGISRDITERTRAEEALRKSEQGFRQFFERNSSVMLLINPVSGAIIDANGEAIRFYGYAREALLQMSVNDINTQGAEGVALERQRAMHGERTVFGCRHRLASGEIRDVESYVTPVETAGQPSLLAIIHDVTERKRIENALLESEERLRLALSASSQWWFDIDLDTGRIDVSPEYLSIVGHDSDAFSSTIDAWVSGVHPEDRIGLMAELERCREDDEAHIAEYRRRFRDGNWHWIRSAGKVVGRNGTQNGRIIGIHADVTEWKCLEENVRQLAFYDALTGLPNRRLLNDRLNQAMAVSKRTGRYCALMFVDLDNFKPLNDTHGHEAGDLLLIEVARRMKGCVREMDTVARFGGDEFVVMICELDKNGDEVPVAQVRVVAEKIRQALAQPYKLEIVHEGASPLAVEHCCSASIGVTLFVNHEIDAGEILKRADLAMYRAKDEGRNTVHFYAKS